MTGMEWVVLGLGLILFAAVGLFGWALTKH